MDETHLVKLFRRSRQTSVTLDVFVTSCLSRHWSAGETNRLLMDEVIYFDKRPPAWKQPRYLRTKLPELICVKPRLLEERRTVYLTLKKWKEAARNVFPSLQSFYLYFILVRRDEGINVHNPLITQLKPFWHTDTELHLQILHPCHGKQTAAVLFRLPEDEQRDDITFIIKLRRANMLSV